MILLTTFQPLSTIERGQGTLPKEIAHAGLAGTPLSSRGDMEWSRSQLRPLRGTCQRGRAVPLRVIRCDERKLSHPDAGANRPGIPRLPARRATGATLRLPHP